ncbi:MAG: hypothetical protein QGG74_06670 [Phycisphaerales bacterium]|jgi:hypothetical protein|nr:hypothetical protein [Phycisphaerales bacterium]
MSDDQRTIDTGGGDDPTFRTLLELGRVQDTRPTHTLRFRLIATDGAEWLAEAISVDFDGNSVDTKAMLCSKSGDINSIRTQYQLAKQCFHKADDEDARMRGLLWYLLLMAAAAEHHGVMLSSQPVEIVAGVLLEIAPDLPDPWGDLAARGAMAIG